MTNSPKSPLLQPKFHKGIVSAASPAVQPDIPLPPPQHLTDQQITNLVQDAANKTAPQQSTIPTESPAFKKWFGNSAVQEGGRPVVVYHGTTHEFNKFNLNIGNTEGYYGKGLYFTDSTLDVEKNYATDEGPDITNSVNNRAEQIMQELQDNPDEVVWLGSTPEQMSWGSEDYKKLEEKAKELAKKELMGTHKGVTMPVYLSIQKPVIVEKNGGTQFEINYNPRTGVESGSGLRLYKAMNEVADRWGFSGVDEVWSEIAENLEFTAYDFEEVLRKRDIQDHEGNLSSGAFIADVYRGMGFDGIIMDAYATFGGKRQFGQPMKMDYATKHYIVWNPRQVKSAIGNIGTYNRRSPLLTASQTSEKPSFRIPTQKDGWWNRKTGSGGVYTYLDLLAEHDRILYNSNRQRTNEPAVTESIVKWQREALSILLSHCERYLSFSKRKDVEYLRSEFLTAAKASIEEAEDCYATYQRTFTELSIQNDYTLRQALILQENALTTLHRFIDYLAPSPSEHRAAAGNSKDSDIKDWAIRHKCEIDSQGRVRLYHATPNSTAPTLLKSGLREGSLFETTPKDATFFAYRDRRHNNGRLMSAEDITCFEVWVPMNALYGGVFASLKRSVSPEEVNMKPLPRQKYLASLNLKADGSDQRKKAFFRIEYDDDKGGIRGIVPASYDELEEWFAEKQINNPELLNSLKDDKVAILNNIGVSQLHRGEGVGNELLRKFFAEAKNYQPTVALLIADLDEPQKDGFNLKLWYEKKGFKEVAQDGSSYPVMLKRLNPSAKTSNYNRWLEGDCWYFARALKQKFPEGEYFGVYLIPPSFGYFVHVGLKVGDKVYDARGVQTEAEFLKRNSSRNYREFEKLAPAPEDVVLKFSTDPEVLKEAEKVVNETFEREGIKKQGNSDKPRSKYDKVCYTIATDDKLWDYFCVYVQCSDAFEDYPEASRKVVDLVKSIPPFIPPTTRKCLYRGETIRMGDSRLPAKWEPHLRDLLSWSEAYDTARYFAEHRGIVWQTVGKIQGIALSDIVLWRNRTHPDESNYSGMQSEWFVLNTCNAREVDWQKTSATDIEIDKQSGSFDGNYPDGAYDFYEVPMLPHSVNASADNSSLRELALDAREKVIGSGKAKNGDCEPVADAVYDALTAQRYDSSIAYGYWNNIPHSWNIVGDTYIDATADQFIGSSEESLDDINQEILIGKISDSQYKENYKLNGQRTYSKTGKVAAKKPKFLYHGTSKSNLDSVLKDGLQLKFDNSSFEWGKAIYLACDKITASSYAGHKGIKPEDWVTLQIDTAKLSEYYLRPDDYDFPDLWSRGSMEEGYGIPAEIKKEYGNWATCPWEISLQYTCQVAYLADIPPSAITVLKSAKAVRKAFRNTTKAATQFIPPTLKDFYKNKYGLPLPRNKDELIALEMKYDEAVGQIETLKFPLTIYRAIEIPEGEQPNLDKAGIYWTSNSDAADAYWGGSSLWSGQSSPGKEGRLVILTANVMKEDDVDLWSTFVANFENPEECEVTLREGTQLKLISIEDNKPTTVINQVITAKAAAPSHRIPHSVNAKFLAPRKKLRTEDEFCWVFHPNYGPFFLPGMEGYHFRFFKGSGKEVPQAVMPYKLYDDCNRGYGFVDHTAKTVTLNPSSMVKRELKFVPSKVMDEFKENFPGYQVFSGKLASATEIYYSAQRTVGDIKEGPSLGVYLTTDSRVAETYAGDSGEIKKYTLNIHNPLRIIPENDEFPEYFTSENINAQLRQAGVEFELPEDGDVFWRQLDTGGQRFIHALKKAGYDALIYPDSQGYRQFDTTLIFDRNKLCEHKNAQPITASATTPTLASKLKALRPQLAAAAQKEYDEWDASDEEYGDGEVGFGGICHLIADAMADVITQHIPEAGVQSFSHHDEVHVSLSVWDETQEESERVELFDVDIPPRIYETGGGYTWKKIPDVIFEADDVTIYRQTVSKEDLEFHKNSGAHEDNAKKFQNEEEWMNHHRTGVIPSDVYDKKDFSWLKKQRYPELLKTITLKDGTQAEFRQSGEALKYCKHDENGEIVRDSQGMALYLSDEEMKAKGLHLKDTTIVAFDKEGKPLGYASDEWGADGVFIAPYAQRKGLGVALLTEFRKQFNPERRMGQMTWQGAELARKYYRDLHKQAASRSIFYHGSSIKNLRSILSQGLIPDPKIKNWADDPESSPYTSSRESYGGCFDDATRILTRHNGFKHFNELTSEDEVATLVNGKELAYEKPIAFTRYWYEGPMYAFKINAGS
jgi:GNAT superfamily N-acetyltransferase